jgi:dienelactone hydrolase
MGKFQDVLQPRLLLSRAVFAYLALATTASSTAFAGELTTAKEEQWRSGIRRALFVPAPLPDLAVEKHGQFEPESGVVAERVSYATQFGLRVPAIVYRPKSAATKAPALIVVNGHGGDKFSWYAFYSGIVYARGGAVVLTYDPAGEGERNIDRKSGTRAHDKVEPPTELQQRVGGLMVTDIMQAISYLSSRSDVDPQRIGAMGYSMGSFILGVTGAAEPRLKACVLVGGGNFDGPEGYWDKSKPMCQGTPYRALSFLGDRPAAIYALHASRGSTLVFNGLEDTTVAIPQHGEAHLRDVHARTVALRGNASGVFETVFVPGTGHRPYFVTKPVAAWLERQLDFPAWTSAAIAAMGETHIAEWAKRHGVLMDPLYATEHREGGTRALGENVPGLVRDALFVLSADAWTARKNEFVHESWLREAKARLGK